MKAGRKSLIFIILLMPLFFSCQENKRTIITGNIPLPDGSTVAILGDGMKPLLAGTVENSSFNLDISGVPEGIYQLHVNWPNENIITRRIGSNISRDYAFLSSSISFYKEKNKQYFISSKVSDTNKIKTATIRDRDVLPLYIVTDSKNTVDLVALDSVKKQIDISYAKKQDSLVALSDSLLKYNDMLNYLKTVNENQGLKEAFFKAEILKSHKKFISSRPHSAITPYLITIAPDLALHKHFYEKIIENLDASLNKNRYTVEAKKRLSAIVNLKIGDVFPSIAGEDPDANRIAVKYGSNFTLVEFWASWCAPCRAVNPDWAKIYKAHRKNGFEIIGVSFDTSRDSWKKAIGADGLVWQHISDLLPTDQSENSIRFNIRTIPANYVLDKNRKIVAINVSPENLLSRLVN